MYQTLLLIGGCRSGKSRQALTLAEEITEGSKIFLATCVPQDREMDTRVQRHQAERGANWQTVEEPLDIDQAIQTHGPGAKVILVDCMTLWITNWILAHAQDEPVTQAIHRFCGLIANPPCNLLIVTNEVGTGIVPGDPLSRRFRDLTGWANQQVAGVCQRVIWMVAGIPVPVKPRGSEELGPGR